MSITRSGSRTDPSREALAAALAELGVPCRVEARGALAVLLVGPEAAMRAADAEVRRRALAAAREHGFTHLAIELAGGDTGPDAALPRP